MHLDASIFNKPHKQEKAQPKIEDIHQGKTICPWYRWGDELLYTAS